MQFQHAEQTLDYWIQERYIQFNSKMGGAAGKVIPSINREVDVDKDQDKSVVTFINDGVLRSVYELLLDLSYVLFVAAIGLTVSYNASFGQEFQEYAQQDKQRGIVVALLVMGVIILAANKVHTDFQTVSVSATSRKLLSLVEDILRGVVYVLLLVLVSPFALNHSSVTLLMVSYILYIVSGAFFLSIKIIKWIYFLCGAGKDNDKPWEIPLATLAVIAAAQTKAIQTKTATQAKAAASVNHANQAYQANYSNQVNQSNQANQSNLVNRPNYGGNEIINQIIELIQKNAKQLSEAADLPHAGGSDRRLL